MSIGPSAGLNAVLASPEEQALRFRAARLALLTTLVLTAGKIGVAYLTGSIGVLSEGIHSGLDLVSAATAFFTIREATKPADADHPFGHGKFETLSSLLESLLLIAAAGFIFYEGYEHFLNPHPIQHSGIAMATIFVSLIISWIVYRNNSSVAQATDSSAIRVNALHFLADSVTAFGVLVALALIEWTGYLWIDPLIAVLMGIYIIIISWRQVASAVSELADSRLPDEEIAAIQEVLGTLQAPVIEAHELRTRRSGSNRHIEFHLLMCGKLSVDESHQICDETEEKILEKLPKSFITIHVEPCAHAERTTPPPCSRSAGGVCEFKATQLKTLRA